MSHLTTAKMEPPVQTAPRPEVINVADDLLLETARVAQKSQPTRTCATDDDSDESDDDDRGTEEQKPLISPSTDIKGDFEAVVEEGFEFDGVFAFTQRYPLGDVPNPCLDIDGLGTVGLPLSERDARGIASECALKGSGIWEIPAEKIHFDNPAWDIWIQKTAGVAASTALTAYINLRPTFALKKLVMHDQSCQPTNYKESVGDDETSRKIGDFIVLLPSLFDGAQLQLSHAGQTKTINFAHQSKLSTSVVAAYSGVEHTLSSVSAGYRLSLVYEIVQPITDAAFVRPTLPEMQGATQKLRNILLSWKQDASGEEPEFLACLLQHKYAQAPTFSAKSLIGADALLVSHLRPLARELKFRLYLAHITATVSTSLHAEDYGHSYRYGYGRRYRGWCDFDSEDEPDEDEFMDDGDCETALDVSQVVGLSGMPVNVDLDLDIDDFLRGPITDDDPDDEDFERYDRTSASRNSVYKRTAILIWPTNSAIDGRVSVGDVYDYALHILQNSLTPAPTKREAKMVDALLECCRTRPQNDKMQRVMQTLRESADRWNDVQILLRALKVCGVDKNADLLGVEGFVSAYQAFGWSALKDFCGEVMVHDTSINRRRVLLTRLTQMGEEEGDAEVSAWCTAQADTLLHAVGKIDASHIPWLMDVATTRGGEFFRDVIIPQLAAQKLDRAFWSAFCKQLHQNASIASLALMRELVVRCVSELVRGLPAFPTKDVSMYRSYMYAGRKEKDSAETLKAIQLCIETKNEALCGEIFTKMRNAARTGAFLPEFPPWLYYAELSPPVIQAMQSAPTSAGLDSTFVPFFVDVVGSMVSAVRTTPDGKAITPCPLSDQHKAIVATAARKAGGISVLKQSLSAAGLKAHDCSSLQGLARFIAKEFPRQQMSGSGDVQAHDELIVNLVRAAIDTFDTSTLAKVGTIYKAATYPYNIVDRFATSDQMIRLVQFCFEVGARNECGRLLLRFVAPPTGSSIENHVSKVLAPFLPVLKQYLVAQRMDFRADPYKKFAAAVIKAFAEKVMAQKPREVVPAVQLQTIGCSCGDCLELRAFFLSDRVTISFARVQAIRTHLENALKPTRMWGVSWDTIRSGSPHTLKVTKPASMTALGLWTGNSQKGQSLLKDLGDPATQVAILGGDYSWVHARIHGTGTGTGPASAPPASVPQSSSAQNLKRPANAGLEANTTKKPRV